MSQPNVVITAQPAEGASLVYGQLAAKSSLDQPNGQLSIVLTMTNLEASQVVLQQVLVSFPGSNVPQSAIATSWKIDPSQKTLWYFATENHILLPEPAPDTVTISCSFDNYTPPSGRGGDERGAPGSGEQGADEGEDAARRLSPSCSAGRLTSMCSPA